MWALKTSAATVSLGKLSIMVLVVAASLIAYSRLSHRGYLK
jgi:hypothetical protein